MRRYAQIIKLRPEVKEEYIRYHADVWPGVLDRIAQCNIRNYSIYLHDDLLIAYFEYHGTDFDADMKLMAADSETQRWWKIMDPMQVSLPEAAAAGKHWLEVPEVFHFDGPPVV
ncbi:MAG: L-rhamnose mutarotase [Edaphobacter sp.]|uniref:L-rhamnose mutarotase n=1 Tax=Edaphobacter sp. TaxID=1934404 RepID=UPI00238D0C9D|nr:L-rhamnose mutarotase [Edaphobacter sp.]MDE1178016.1 L-rhamnose mutarotase [Edaphobacter sp.]